MGNSAYKPLALLIKEKALELGFDLCGIAQAREMAECKPALTEWCNAGMNGEMSYLCNDLEKRINPAVLFPGAKSVIVTGLNYYNPKLQGGDRVPVISRYAYGEDYHKVIKNKLNKLLAFIISTSEGTGGKCFVDSAPLLEKVWAKEAGLGWQGRHSILINRKLGSFFFIGAIVLNKELDYDEAYNEDLCGPCRICIDSCPTAAINENRTIDARKCIAYQTIENRNSVPDELAQKMEGRIFGCDKCQEVCPWNIYAAINRTPEFSIPEDLAKMTSDEWLNLSFEDFNRLFSKSAVKRVKYEGLIRNIRLAFS